MAFLPPRPSTDRGGESSVNMYMYIHVQVFSAQLTCGVCRVMA